MSWKPTVAYVKGLARLVSKAKESFEPEKDKDGYISARDWLRIRHENTEPWEDPIAIFEAKVAYEAAESVAGEAEVKVSKRNAENASKPRPKRQHRRKDEALDIAADITKTNPSMSVRSVAVRTRYNMPGDDLPAFETIARWIKE